MVMAAVKLVAAFSLAVSLTLSPGMACLRGRGANTQAVGTCASRSDYVPNTCCPLRDCKAADGHCFCDTICTKYGDCCADHHCVKSEYNDI